MVAGYWGGVGWMVGGGWESARGEWHLKLPFSTEEILLGWKNSLLKHVCFVFSEMAFLRRREVWGGMALMQWVVTHWMRCQFLCTCCSK